MKDILINIRPIIIATVDIILCFVNLSLLFFAPYNTLIRIPHRLAAITYTTRVYVSAIICNSEANPDNNLQQKSI